MLNNLKSALFHPFNVIFLAVCASLSGALVVLYPLFFGIGIDVIYLLLGTFAPEKSAIHQFILTKPFGELRFPGHRTPIEKVNKQNVLPMLSAEVKLQYSTLEYHCKAIRTYLDLETPIGADISASLDYLLNKFLLFGVRELEFRERLIILAEEAESFLAGTDGNPRPHLTLVDKHGEPGKDESVASLVRRAHCAYSAESEKTAANLAGGDGALATTTVSERLPILRRRMKQVEYVGKSIQNVTLEMNKIGFMIQSLHDDDLMSAPVQAAKDLKGLIVETDSVTRTIERVAPLEELAFRVAA